MKITKLKQWVSYSGLGVKLLSKQYYTTSYNSFAPGLDQGDEIVSLP